MSQPILEIKNLHAGVEGKQILKGVDLTLNLVTAKRLGDPKALALDLITFAAQKGLAVRVVE